MSNMFLIGAMDACGGLLPLVRVVVQLIKISGKVEPTEIGKHILLSENTLPKSGKNKEPASYYYDREIQC